MEPSNKDTDEYPVVSQTASNKPAIASMSTNVTSKPK
jgi:hypothetical protein